MATDPHKELKAKGKTEYLNALVEIGWYDYLQNNREKIEASFTDDNADEFHLNLHHLTILNDDFETVDGYKNLFKKVEKITEIPFLSSDFELDEDSNELSVSIKTKTKTISLEFDMNDEYIVQEIPKSINHLVDEHQLESNFLWLPLESEIMFYVFIPADLCIKAVNIGVLPKSDDYIDQLYDEYEIEEELEF
jgi:hypothetical protein